VRSVVVPPTTSPVLGDAVSASDVGVAAVNVMGVAVSNGA
jgi:hypothetical protein